MKYLIILAALSVNACAPLAATAIGVATGVVLQADKEIIKKEDLQAK